jgi:hypothetical protein
MAVKDIVRMAVKPNRQLNSFIFLKIEFICLYPYRQRMRWAGHVARMGEKRNAYRILVGKPEGKRPLG